MPPPLRKTSLFESKPRFRGAPLVCLASNFMAFKDERAIKVFHESNSPSCSITKQWLCETCNHWHFNGEAPEISGGSSGKKRKRK